MTAMMLALIALASASDTVTSGTLSLGHSVSAAGVLRLPTSAQVCWERAGDANGTCIFADPNGVLRTPLRERHVDLPVHAMGKGTTAPSDIEIGTLMCVMFDQTKPGEMLHATVEVPSDWDRATTPTLEAHSYAAAGDAVANGEVIEWDVSYRVLSNGEPYDDGNAATLSLTYTQSGDGTDKARQTASSTVPVSHAEHPLVAGATLGLEVDLDEVATTYSGDPALCYVHFVYQSDRLSTQ